MRVLVLDKMAYRVDRCLIGFLDAGAFVTGTPSVAVAERVIDRYAPDLLVIAAATSGSSTRKLVQAAEAAHPGVATLLLAADVARATDIAAKSMPSVHCVLSADVEPEQVVRFGLSSLQTVETFAPAAAMPSHAPAAPPPHVPREATPQPATEPAPVFASKRRRLSLAPTAAAA